MNRSRGSIRICIAKILGLLRELKAMGSWWSSSSMTITSVREVADLVIVMDEGRVIAQGSPAEVLERQRLWKRTLVDG